MANATTQIQPIYREEREAREALVFAEPGMVIAVIGSAIEVHRELGPGLLESAYCHCLAHELTRRGIPFLREYSLPIRYKGEVVDCGYRLDFLIGDSLLLEIKSVDALSAVHQAQTLTYLKLSGIEHGLLINFNARLVRDGIKSFLLTRSAANSKWTEDPKLFE